jgi:hypothetical protein
MALGGAGERFGDLLLMMPELIKRREANSIY